MKTGQTAYGLRAIWTAWPSPLSTQARERLKYATSAVTLPLYCCGGISGSLGSQPKLLTQELSVEALKPAIARLAATFAKG